MDTCNNVQMYITFNKTFCVQTCDDDFTSGKNADEKVFCVCRDYKYYDMDKDICVDGRECKGYRYSLDRDLK